jgi:hypothetical protein
MELVLTTDRLRYRPWNRVRHGVVRHDCPKPRRVSAHWNPYKFSGITNFAGISKSYIAGVIDWVASEPTITAGLLAKYFETRTAPKILIGASASSTIALDKEFNELASRWYLETRKISSAEQIVLNPAYQKIIGMGKEALPFIFKELKKTRGHWIWALAMIVREDKAKSGMKFREAVDAWLEWGEKNGYV